MNDFCALRQEEQPEYFSDRFPFGELPLLTDQDSDKADDGEKDNVDDRSFGQGAAGSKNVFVVGLGRKPFP